MTERWQLAPKTPYFTVFGLAECLILQVWEFWNALFYKFCGVGSVLFGVG